MQTYPVITLDGPSGVGKGTVGMRLARALGWHFLDSGALYRMVAWQANQQGVGMAPEDTDDLLAMLAAMNMDFSLGEEGEPCEIKINGEVVTKAIRTEACGRLASKIAAYPALREALRGVQRDCRQAPGLVADGRDMGTIIFPDAPFKFFLDASCEERAERRFQQLLRAGHQPDKAALLKDLKARDDRDRNREIAPLRPAADALCINTTEMDAEAVFQTIWRVVS